MEDDIFEQNLCHIRRCYVYKIPPRNTGMGYRAAGWTNQIWYGSLNVVLRGKTCFIELVDDNKKIFASTMIRDDGPSVRDDILMLFLGYWTCLRFFSLFRYAYWKGS